MFRKETVRRKLQFKLNKVLERLHILDGLLIVFLNIDEVIKIIRNADEPKKELIKVFKITEIQATAILELKLRQLAKLEEIKIKQEQTELAKERKSLEQTLNSTRRLKTLIRDELLNDAENYGDGRRSPIVERSEAQAIKETEMLPTELVTVILSSKGWIRAGKGHEIDVMTLNYKSGDSYKDSEKGRSNQVAIFVDSGGRTYSLPAHVLSSARGYGEPITGRVNPPPYSTFEAVLMGDDEQYILVASDVGYGFIVQLKELLTKNKAGKAILRLPKHARILKPQYIPDLESDLIASVTIQGRLLIFPVRNLPILPRGKGNKIIQIPPSQAVNREDFIVNSVILSSGQTLKLFSGKRCLTLKENDLIYYKGDRGKRGRKLPRGYQRVDYVAVVGD